MIPCIAIPVLNRPDLLKRCVDSIDLPVEWLVIVDNGGIVDPSFDAPEIVQNVHVHRPGINYGVAGSWNFAMDHVFGTLKLDAVMLIGSDIQWLPGQLETFWQTWDANRDASLLFAFWSFSTFMVTRTGFDTMGWFDENFYPAYLEDSDFWWRVGRYKKLGVDVKTVDVPVTPIHGESPHWGSSTLKSDSAIARQVAEGHRKNWAYYTQKWGGQIAGNSERFDTPFNAGGPVNAWKLGPDRLRQPHYRAHS